MNKLIKINENEWKLECEDGSTFIGKLWIEKKKNKDGSEKLNYHVKLPKDNPSGRQYVNLSKLDKDGNYTFETDHSTREGGGWRSRLTPEEEIELEEAEATIERIKKTAMARGTDEVSKLEREIAKKLAELEALKAKRA